MKRRATVDPSAILAATLEDPDLDDTDVRVLDAAESWLGATRVELEVFALNKRAIALYGSVGFEAEGVRRSMGWQDGDLADGIVMARVKG